MNKPNDTEKARQRILALQRKIDDPSVTDAERLSAKALQRHIAQSNNILLRVNAPPKQSSGLDWAAVGVKRKAEVGSEPPDFLSKYKPKTFDNFDHRDEAKEKDND